ncbi:GntR family transcriptional regulator [Mycoplasma todarodis]|uniref:HTH gntR-type domain-containing protein n=1 Tax=Mycoplasma todarodis TaxID=1937191 RepID=A0A4R0XWF7_9MOLU|nr:GntR family transcriptional regulator [Mycoplasma todarodis]TCG11311.1 hypothetical protein C4B25_01860 [Mycoplasma todarodis]
MAQTKESQIRSYLINEIVNGKLSEGKRLPSETQLSIKFDCSRTTARNALRVLLSAGLIESSRGKQYVVSIRENSTGFLSPNRIYGTTRSTTELIDIKDIVIDKIWLTSTIFYKKMFDKENVHALRKRYFDGEKLIVEQYTFINKEFCQKIDVEAIKKSIFQYIDSLNVGVNHSNEFVIFSEEKAHQPKASKFGWGKPYPMIATTLENKETWVEFSIKWVDKTRFKFNSYHKIFK